MTLAPGSLQRRLVLGAILFILAALLFAAVAIYLELDRFVRRQIDDRLEAQIATVAAALQVGRDGALSIGHVVDGPPFDRPMSGWYWQVYGGGASLRSQSLGGKDLEQPLEPEAPPRPRPHKRPKLPPDGIAPPEPPMPYPEGAASAEGVGPRGEALIMRVARVTPDGGAPVMLVATAPLEAERRPLADAVSTLAKALAALGLFLAGAVLLQVRLGLRPLGELRDALADVRVGRRERVPEDQPAEIRPLVAEVNALLEHNQANLSRARMHVANLAHSLKTPLATLMLATGDKSRDPDGQLKFVADLMDRRVRHHLRRARAAALSGAPRTRTLVAPRVADLLTAVGRIYAEKSIAFGSTVGDAVVAACDGEDVDEMLGNLLDNACKWCRCRVAVTARREAASVLIEVEDDGAGLSEEEVSTVMQPGRRLDESMPGTGFGLPITRELAELYGGQLRLSRSELGGVRASLTVPAA